MGEACGKGSCVNSLLLCYIDRTKVFRLPMNFSHVMNIIRHPVKMSFTQNFALIFDRIIIYDRYDVDAARTERDNNLLPMVGVVSLYERARFY